MHVAHFLVPLPISAGLRPPPGRQDAKKARGRQYRKQPNRDDFDTDEAFSEAWAEWRAIRERNNAAVRFLLFCFCFCEPTPPPFLLPFSPAPFWDLLSLDTLGSCMLMAVHLFLPRSFAVPSTFLAAVLCTGSSQQGEGQGAQGTRQAGDSREGAGVSASQDRSGHADKECAAADQSAPVPNAAHVPGGGVAPDTVPL